MKHFIFLKIILLLSLFWFPLNFSWAETKKQPVTVNGDMVEFISEGSEVVAEGHVEIVQEGSTLTCDKVKVYMDEKIAIAEGHVKLVKSDQEELQGAMIVYDFSEQTGTIIEPVIRMAPYYGKAQVMEKISDSEFLMSGAEISTCDLPHPHYKLGCREVEMKPGRVMKAKGIKFSLMDDMTLMYLPVYSQRLQDHKPRFMITPGYRKNYGAEFFAAYRYYLNENAQGVLHLDEYQKKGLAEGIDLNYNTKFMGVGNLKYYRIDEKDTRPEIPDEDKRDKQRSRVELRHRWDISPADQVVVEFFKQSDPIFRKDYFYREYEKETSPASFFLYSHAFPNATLSVMEQPRVNKFDTVLQKLPEIKLETINQKIAQTPWYFKNITTAAQLSSATANVAATQDVSRVDMVNQISYLFQWKGIALSPYVGYEDTFYSRGLDAKTEYMRGMFYTGLDMSTKFFKTFDVTTNVAHLDINKIRHIVTPSIQYRYQADPTVSAGRLLALDSIDTLDRSDKVTLSLENKLQTKRGDNVVDLADLLISTDYNVQSSDTQGKSFQNVKYKMAIKPYSWWELDSEAEYDTVGKHFNELTADAWAHWNKDFSTGLGYRAGKGMSNQITLGIGYQMNPFWRLDIYERFELKSGETTEHEYRLTRDMHCWLMEFIVNQREGNGITFMVAFTLKAFPDFGINGEASFNSPRQQGE